jgi:hypothetical protein
MRTRAFPSLAVCLLLFLCLPVPAQTSLKEQSTVHQPVNEDKEPSAILEVGAAANWNTTSGTPTFAPSLAVEMTPVENWLELELGVSPFYTHNSAEWDTDLLFKKPWTISRKAEFGGRWPAVVSPHPKWKDGELDSGRGAGDFMFWPTRKHRLGWFVEPSYDYSFAGGHQQSIGMSTGLLIGLP